MILCDWSVQLLNLVKVTEKVRVNRYDKIYICQVNLKN